MFNVDGCAWTKGVISSVLIVSACVPGDQASRPGAVSTLELRGPTNEIGTLEGSDEFTFAAIESVIRLPNGQIAVSDAGSSRISIFDADGGFLASWGQRGDGPGEFRNLASIYPLGDDSIMAAERYPGVLKTFDLRGGLGRTLSGSDLSGDSVFQLDSWLHDRFWVSGALTREARARTRETLAEVPPPLDAAGYRVVLVGDDGTLWLREPMSNGVRTWTRIDGDGRPSGRLTVPTRFRPTHFRSAEVLGVWTGEADVHFVRSYGLGEGAGAESDLPGWLVTQASGLEEESSETLNEEEFLTEIQGAIRSMASAQEIHYSSHMTYTTAIDSLERFERPEAITVDFVQADARGWAAVFTHEQIDRICALGYGFNIPAGWTPGMVVCAPEPAVGG